jgi:hypothetical protein
MGDWGKYSVHWLAITLLAGFLARGAYSKNETSRPWACHLSYVQRRLVYNSMTENNREETLLSCFYPDKQIRKQYVCLCIFVTIKQTERTTELIRCERKCETAATCLCRLRKTHHTKQGYQIQEQLNPNWGATD